MLGDRILEVASDTKDVVTDDLPQPIEPSVEALLPRRGALQPVGGPDVEHQVAVDVAHQRLVVESGREKLCVRGTLAAISADVEVPTILGRDHADILAACLSALAGTPRHAEFDLVW